MSQSELVIHVFAMLDTLGIPAMLTGSHASSLHGDARSTHDIDYVVDLKADRIDGLIAAFPPDEFYITRAAVEEAFHTRRTFNVQCFATGDKVDFWMLTNDEFDQSRFARRRPERIEGKMIPVSSPEDTILQKLRWAALCGGSEKQFLDARGVFEVQYGTLDMAYLDRWIEELGLHDLWHRLRAEAIVGEDSTDQPHIDT